jgi:hypothetical protein
MNAFSVDCDFDAAGPELAAVAMSLDEPCTPSHDLPPLRRIGRPPSWRQPSPPEIALTPIYDSAARRAREILARRRP